MTDDIISTPFSLPFDGETIFGDVYSPAQKNHASPVIVFVHGFKGFKDWGFFPYSAQFFAQRGYTSITFNFSLNGYKPGSDRVESPQNFACNTISREVSELRFVVQSLLDGLILPSFASRQIILVGHSRGGGVALLAANANVSKAIVWNSVASFDRFSKRQKDEWRKTGSFPVENSRTGQLLGMNLAYLDDVEQTVGADGVAKAMANTHIPALLIHAEQDLTVPIREAERLHAASDGRTLLERIEKTGHTFGVVHPFAGCTSAMETVLTRTLEFIEKYQ